MKQRARAVVPQYSDHSWTHLSGGRKIDFGWEDGEPFVFAVDESGDVLINVDNHDSNTLSQLVSLLRQWVG